MAKINIKDLATKIKTNQAEQVQPNKEVDVQTEVTKDVVEPKKLTDEIKESEAVQSVREVPETPKSEVQAPVVVEKPVLVNEPDKQKEVNPEPVFDLDDVIKWKRPETTGKKKLVELHKEYDTFFAKVKATTGISTVKFVNYLVRDFLLKNPDFVRFINEESGKSPQLE